MNRTEWKQSEHNRRLANWHDIKPSELATFISETAKVRKQSLDLLATIHRENQQSIPMCCQSESLIAFGRSVLWGDIPRLQKERHPETYGMSLAETIRHYYKGASLVRVKNDCDQEMEERERTIVNAISHEHSDESLSLEVNIR